ncbi:hypothetical protein B0H10DRAFT_2239528 [Mycena sp. CBHHK59/15]|nr:hypothetical protein B0H10DRAFT_2239528 [Mycena sp. CBHHK59/15]
MKMPSHLLSENLEGEGEGVGNPAASNSISSSADIKLLPPVPASDDEYSDLPDLQTIPDSDDEPEPKDEDLFAQSPTLTCFNADDVALDMDVHEWYLDGDDEGSEYEGSGDESGNVLDDDE